MPLALGQPKKNGINRDNGQENETRQKDSTPTYSTSPHDPNGHSALLVMCALQNKAAIDRHAVIVHAQGIIDFNLSLPLFKKYT